MALKEPTSLVITDVTSSVTDPMKDTSVDEVAVGLRRPGISPPVQSPSASSVPKLRPRPPRSPSPVWDIELDLNDSPPPPSDVLDDLPARKKTKTDHMFGNPDAILASE